MRTTERTDVKPGYLVVQTCPGEELNQQVIFDGDLVTARKAAITLVESLRYQRENDNCFAPLIELYLIEANADSRQVIRYITRIYLSESPHAGPISGRHDETVGGADGAEAGYFKALNDLQLEYDYYLQQNHPMGFGVFQLSIYEGHYQSTSAYEITMLHDALGFAMMLVGLYNDHYLPADKQRIHFAINWIDSPEVSLEPDHG